MAVEFGTGKTVFILALVAGCFAVLWPKLFYPMLLASFSSKPPIDMSQACCDVIFETDVNAIKIIAEMCGRILHRHDDLNPKLVQAFQDGKFSNEIVSTCKNEVLEKCDVDITAFLNEKVRLGHTYKQILDEVRSVNSSFCLKHNFGVAPSSIGVPRQMRVRIAKLPNHFRQERPPHLRPEFMHPALRERGRAIPQSHVVPKIINKESRPMPVPGVRPPMGGAGHVVPAPKSSSMSIIMPLYSIGILIFFLYTIMKWGSRAFSRKDVSDQYGEFIPDPEFRKMVFSEECVENGRMKRDSYASSWRGTDDYATKLVVTAITGLMAEVDHQRDVMAKRAEKQKEEDVSSKEDVSEDVKNEHKEVESLSSEVADAKSNTTSLANGKVVAAAESPEQLGDAVSHAVSELVNSSEELDESGGARVKVLGMETTASCEGGQRWSRPPTPVLGMAPRSRSSTPIPPPLTPEPQAIFLEGALPSQSQLLVYDSETQQMKSDDTDAPVILSGKMTLSLISLDSALAAEDEEHAQAAKVEEIVAESSHIKESTEIATDSQLERLVPDGNIQEETEPVLTSSLDELDKLKELESALKENETSAVKEQEEVEEIEEEEEESEEEVEQEDEENQLAATHLVNDTGHSESVITSANYTTASAAAEATNAATGSEETAADFSALQSIGPDDDLQEIEEDLGEEEVWNGDVHSEEEAESEEEEKDQDLLPHNVEGGGENLAEDTDEAAVAPPCPSSQRQR